ncbi:hypothetical protein CABS01_02675 [Colletotrichum abscissum]|uniref:Major facilitator superfamily (MFS) profile domain-containing protein n=1 Tax=Colletotrichum abscissum TaxID=1671311 RepID=A0A9P9XPZ4_9PEZI|nr:uncharacterized protein CABS01_02675 [Colletotrichum abscissum]KAI3558115.1 hypothetical protein CABS02_01788 [Colletotrichum abscissum]KAK1482939.1 hypothetical protein CABS01_02675 [Colletotrichum abscissum]
MHHLEGPWAAADSTRRPPYNSEASDLSRDDRRPLIHVQSTDSAKTRIEPLESGQTQRPKTSVTAEPGAAHVTGAPHGSYNKLSNTDWGSAELPRHGGWDYTPGRTDTKSHLSHRESGLTPSAPKQPWSTSLKGWLPELIWSIISIASVAALAGVLSRFDGQRLPEWPLGLTLNTLIAFLATLARAAFVIPVSESLSQLKWLWYRKARPLKDFQDFDSASRGPWGSIQLLKTTKGWSPSLIATIVMITAIFTSTLTQSAVTYPVRLARVDGDATVPRSTSYFFSTSNTFSSLQQENYVQQSIFEGLSYDHTQEFPLSPARCPTSECQWETYSSLSICAKFWNVTDSLNVTIRETPTGTPRVKASLPNGISADLSSNHFGLVSLRGTSKPIVSDVDPEAALFNFTVIYSLRDGVEGTVGATEAVLYLCAKTYNLSFNGNIESRKVVEITSDVEQGSITFPSGQVRDDLPAIRDPLNPDGENFPYGGTGFGAMQGSLRNALNGSYSDLSNVPSALGLAPARYLAAIQYGAKTLEAQGRENVSQEVVINEAVANITNNVARSLSNRGQALASETFVQVRWPWLAFISCQAVLSIMLLALAIVQTKAAGIGVVKSSTLQAMVAINSKDKQALEIGLAQGHHQEEVDDVVRRGPGIAWSFGTVETTFAMSRQLLHRGLAETGLLALGRSHPDIKLLCLQRFVRMFAYGATTLQLVAYFELLGLSATRIGLFMAFTLVGDVCISLVLTSIADGVGRKAVLAAGAALMAVSGVVFATCSGFWVLLAAAVVGVISPRYVSHIPLKEFRRVRLITTSGAEIGPFRAVEESIVAHLTTAEDRSDVYAWYSLMGAAGTAFGAMTSGWTAHYLTTSAGWSFEHAYRVVFYGYAALGVLKLFLALLLSRDIEAEREEAGASAEETTPILGERSAEREFEVKTWRSKIVPRIERESMPVVATLCFFFALDSFASSLTTQSWIAFFFRWKFNVDDGTLGSLFFTTSLLAAATTLVASSIAKRIGNLNAMVFTHLPSTIFTALIPLPRDATMAIVFLIFRALTHSMDVAPRAAFLAGVILPKERTTVLGLINVLKTCTSSVGPVGVGILVDKNLFWVAFVGAGCLKVVYDLGMLVSFRKHERELRDGAAGSA